MSEDLALLGAVVTLMPGIGAQAISAASSPAARKVEEAQFDAGEGPTRDAFAARRPVLVRREPVQQKLGGGLCESPALHRVQAALELELELVAHRRLHLRCPHRFRGLRLQHTGARLVRPLVSPVGCGAVAGALGWLVTSMTGATFLGGVAGGAAAVTSMACLLLVGRSTFVEIFRIVTSSIRAAGGGGAGAGTPSSGPVAS
jgi:hypothetical protein